MPVKQSIEQYRHSAKSILDKTIPRDNPCALIDFPDHSNVGDSAIWLGEIAYSRTATLDVRYVASIHSYSEAVLRRSLPYGVVMIHGGGNFGSLWKHHQDFRNAVLKNLRDYKVIQLPQSLFFGDDRASFELARNLIQNHPDFTLLVRDKPSLEIGNALGANTILCPDSAAFLSGSLKREPAQFDFLRLVRTDIESTNSQWPQLPDKYSCETADWIEETHLPINWLLHKLQQRAHGRFGHTRSFQCALLTVFNAVAKMRVQRGTRLLSKGRVVVTDRLHAHLLATLLGIPNVAADNQYGKIHSYMECWPSELGEACTNVEEIWSKAIEHL